MPIYLQTQKKGTYGSYVIDRVIGGRRLKVATGTKDLRTARRMDDMIQQLLDRGMDEMVRSLLGAGRKKKEKLRVFYEQDQRGTLYNPHNDPETARLLKPALDEWTTTYKKARPGDKFGWSDKTRKANKEFLATMYGKLGDRIPTSTVADIPKLLRLYSDICENEDHPRVFNLVHACLQRLLRVQFGKKSPLYTDVVDIEKLSDQPKHAQTAKTPAQIEKLCRIIPEKYRRMVWTMCTTGTGWDEYSKMTPRDDLKNPRIYIEGTKMDRHDKRRRREVPFIYAPAPQQGTERHFNKVLKAASRKLGFTDPPITAYAFRKCYATWLRDLVPEWRIEMYMGHAPTTQTRKYQKEEVWQWLRDDAAIIKSWIETEKTKIGPRTHSPDIVPPNEPSPLMT